jgi:hypothetical protein
VYGGTGLGHLDTGLLPGRAYRWRVEAVRGGSVVGEATVSATTPAAVIGPLTGRAVSPSRIDLAWADPGGLDEVALQSSIGQVGRWAGGTTAASHTGLAASTAYNYRVDGLRGGLVVASANVNGITTLAPQYAQRTWSGLATAVASYGQSGAKRTDTSNAYAGYYSSTWGTQRSLWTFDIPAEVRSCHSIDSVKVAVWSAHTYQNSGASVGLVVHHGSVAGGTFPGSTGAFGTFHAPKGGWVGQTGDGWLDVGRYTTPGRTTVAEEIRAHGATGFGLAATTTSQAGYMYATGTGADRPKLAITYTVRI